MKFNWVEYNNLAKEIAKLSIPEDIDLESISPQASLRCAISRSYYSAFCEARAYLHKFEHITIRQEEKRSVHQRVIHEFITDTGTKKKIGQNLKDLLLERKKVDYEDIYLGLNLKKAQLCVRKAEFVIADLRKLSSKR